MRHGFPNILVSSSSSLVVLSGTLESMNKANKEMRAQTAIDLLNACMLLIKLECEWFNKMKQDARGGTSVLTPWGIEEYEATFTNLSPSNFIFNLRDYDDYWCRWGYCDTTWPVQNSRLCSYQSLLLMNCILGHALAEPTKPMRCRLSTWLQLR